MPKAAFPSCLERYKRSMPLKTFLGLNGQLHPRFGWTAAEDPRLVHCIERPVSLERTGASVGRPGHQVATVSGRSRPLARRSTRASLLRQSTSSTGARKSWIHPEEGMADF